MKGAGLMNILIVENNKTDLSDMIELLEHFSNDTEIEINYFVEDDYQKILTIHHQYDIVMMDIELNDGINGVELAKMIRKSNKDIKIIFLSNYNRYLLDGYKAKADLYLLKPIQQSLFNQEMMEIVSDAIYHTKGIIDERLSQTKIYFSDILYIEMLSRKLNLHFLDGRIISCYDTLIKWLDLLKECPFAQIHRSFVVNMEHIIKFEKKSITLKNNETLQITDVYFEKFKADYIRYLNRRT